MTDSLLSRGPVLKGGLARLPKIWLRNASFRCQKQIIHLYSSEFLCLVNNRSFKMSKPWWILWNRFHLQTIDKRYVTWFVQKLRIASSFKYYSGSQNNICKNFRLKQFFRKQKCDWVHFFEFWSFWKL